MPWWGSSPSWKTTEAGGWGPEGLRTACYTHTHTLRQAPREGAQGLSAGVGWTRGLGAQPPGSHLLRVAAGRREAEGEASGICVTSDGSHLSFSSDSTARHLQTFPGNSLLPDMDATLSGNLSPEGAGAKC